MGLLSAFSVAVPAAVLDRMLTVKAGQERLFDNINSREIRAGARSLRIAHRNGLRMSSED
jgi:hypothetical protein